MKRNLKSILKRGLVLVCILSLVCLPFTKALAAIYEPAKAPKIVSFTASSANVAEGERVVLKWVVVNATSIQIKGLEQSEELPLSGSAEVCPLETTDYVLTVTSAGGSAKKTITVNVDGVANVTIDYFTASTTEVSLGNTVDLSWKTTNAKSISIIGLEKIDEDVILPLTGSLEVFPAATTTYYLRAVGENNEVVTKSITVNVTSISGTESLLMEKKVHDWGSEYIMNVDVTNTSNKAISDWTLTLKKSEFDMKIIWGADMMESGDSVMITPLHYNSTIKPGGTISFGFQAFDSPVANFYYMFDWKMNE